MHLHLQEQNTAFGKDFFLPSQCLIEANWQNVMSSTLSSLCKEFLPCYIEPMSSNHTNNVSYHLLNSFGTTGILKTLFVFQLSSSERSLLFPWFWDKSSVVQKIETNHVNILSGFMAAVSCLLGNFSSDLEEKTWYSFAYSSYSVFSKP